MRLLFTLQLALVKLNVAPDLLFVVFDGQARCVPSFGLIKRCFGRPVSGVVVVYLGEPIFFRRRVLLLCLLVMLISLDSNVYARKLLLP